MAQVRYATNEEVPESARGLFEGIERKGNKVPNFLRALGNAPDILQGFLALNGALGKTKLDPKLRELTYTLVSEINGCSYCLSHHRESARKVGVDDRQINEVATFETSDAFDDFQKAVLRYAVETTRDVRPQAPTLAKLKERLTDRELVELTVTIGLAQLTNRVNEAFQVELP